MEAGPKHVQRGGGAESVGRGLESEIWAERARLSGAWEKAKSKEVGPQPWRRGQGVKVVPGF